jgi:hypothetical protein
MLFAELFRVTPVFVAKALEFSSVFVAAAWKS